MSTNRSDVVASEDRAWLDAPAEHAPTVFAELYSRHVAAVYRYSLHVLRHATEAEEITQDVFVLAWTKRTSIHLVDQSLLPWLLVTSRNLSLNRVKQLRRRDVRTTASAMGSDAEGVHPSVEDEVASRQLATAIDDAVDELSLTDQTLYHLCISEDLTYLQAADVLGTTHSAVRNRLSRLRRGLRTTLTPFREGLS